MQLFMGPKAWHGNFFRIKSGFLLLKIVFLFHTCKPSFLGLLFPLFFIIHLWLLMSLFVLKISFVFKFIVLCLRSKEISINQPILFRSMTNSGKLILISWTILIMFFVMFFNCNLRAYLVKVDFNDPAGNKNKIRMAF